MIPTINIPLLEPTLVLICKIIYWVWCLLLGLHRRIFQLNGPKPHPYLRFHRNHGKNIQLKGNSTIASRVSSFHGGIVFSASHIRPEEQVPVKILGLLPEYKGRLFFGFTSHDPSRLSSYELANIFCREDYPPGYWGEEVHISDLGPSQTIYFKYLQSGSLVVTAMDGNQLISQMEGHRSTSDQPLWAFVNLYGNVGSVMLVYLPMLETPKKKQYYIQTVRRPLIKIRKQVAPPAPAPAQTRIPVPVAFRTNQRGLVKSKQQRSEQGRGASARNLC